MRVKLAEKGLLTELVNYYTLLSNTSYSDLLKVSGTKKIEFTNNGPRDYPRVCLQKMFCSIY